MNWPDPSSPAIRFAALATIAVVTLAQPKAVTAEQENCVGYSVSCMLHCDAGNEVDTCANERPGCFIAVPQCSYDTQLCGTITPMKLKCTFTGSP